MTTLKLYPTVVDSNSGSWVNPNNALGKDDSVCAYKNVAPYAHVELHLGSFRDESGNMPNIPSGAIIDSEKIGIKGTVKNNVALWMWHTFHGNIDSSVICTTQYAASPCTEGIWEWANITALFWLTVAQINAASYTGDVVAENSSSGYMRGDCDAICLEITYHLPAVGTEPLMDGMVFIE